MTALMEMGCERAQGFLMGRPCAPDVVEELFAPRQAAAALARDASVTETSA